MYGQTVEKKNKKRFVDPAEVSAYADVVNGVETERIPENNYKHLDDGVDKLLSSD